MSLYAYKVRLVDGEEKSGKTTAKTEEAARLRVAEENNVTAWLSLKVLPSPKATNPALIEKAPSKPAKTAPATKLDKLLFLQSSKCFFCARTLTKAEASVEHLLAASKGGTNDDENVVACCVTLNRAFGSIGLREKIRIILDKAGDFRCPGQ